MTEAQCKGSWELGTACGKCSRCVEALLARAEAAEKLLTTAGIVEIAARNPSVMEYMRHWEGRTEAAEARLAEVEAALQTVAAVLQAEMGRSGGKHFSGTWTIPALGIRTTCREALDKANARLSPTDAQEQGKTVPCGGCGETDPDKRCIGCFHEFRPGGTP